MSLIGDRVEAIDPEEAEATREELERLLNIWRKAALADADLPYQATKKSPQALLIDSSKALEDPDFVYSTSTIPMAYAAEHARCRRRNHPPPRPTKEGRLPWLRRHTPPGAAS